MPRRHQQARHVDKEGNPVVLGSLVKAYACCVNRRYVGTVADIKGGGTVIVATKGDPECLCEVEGIEVLGEDKAS